MTIDKDRFLKAAVPEGVVTIPGEGDVRVRGLSRVEVLGLQSLATDQAALEQRIIVLGMVDPALSEADVAAWYVSAPAGHTDLIVNKISALSGITEGAPKELYLAFEESEELEMEFFLAEQLGMTVAALRREISNDEFARWAIYFARKAQRRQLEGP